MNAISSVNFKIVMIGDQAVGKTSAVRRFVDNRFLEAYIPTLGFEISVKPLQIGDTTIILSIWDLGAQQCFDPIRTKYYEGARGFLVVFNLTIRGTFKNLDSWIPDIQNICPDARILLVGNKCDLPDRCISEEEIMEKVEKYGALGFIISSAKTGEGIAEGFTILGESILSSFKTETEAILLDCH